MFQYDPVKRPSASDVLEHPYFTTEEPKPRQAVEYVPSFLFFRPMAKISIDFQSWKETGTNSNPKRYEKRMSEKIRKHVGRRRKKLLSKQKRRRSVGLKGKLESETRNDSRWVPLACLFRNPRPLGERSEIKNVCV